MSDDMFYCSFVSIHYIICECGETFPNEDELKNHLERDHAMKKEKKEIKCGVVSSSMYSATFAIHFRVRYVCMLGKKWG